MRRRKTGRKKVDGLIIIKGVESQTTFVTSNSGILRSTASGER